VSVASTETDDWLERPEEVHYSQYHTEFAKGVKVFCVVMAVFVVVSMVSMIRMVVVVGMVVVVFITVVVVGTVVM